MARPIHCNGGRPPATQSAWLDASADVNAHLQMAQERLALPTSGVLTDISTFELRARTIARLQVEQEAHRQLIDEFGAA